MLAKKGLLLFFISFTIILLASNVVSLAGTLIEDFDDGEMDGWERSPQNEKNKNVFWGIVDKAMMFDPKGEAWDQAISQMNFVGIQGAKNVEEWDDYELEVDIKHAELANYPGGIRGRVDLKMGGHYAIWLYPGTSKINLYKNPGWDINTGLSNMGEAPYKPDIKEYHTVKLSCLGDSITVYYDDDEVISVKDSEHKKGTIALCVQDRVVYFDNIKVTGSKIPNIKLSAVDALEKLTATWGLIKSR